MNGKRTPTRNSTCQPFLARFVLFLLGLLLIAERPASANLIFQLDAGFRDDRILVKPNLGVDLTPLHALLGIQVLRVYPEIGGLQVLELPLGAVVDPIIAIYRQSGLVEYAEHDLIVHGFTTPNDAYFADGSLWGLNNIGQLGGKPDGDIDAPEAWDVTHDAGGIIVAVIDTGVRATHEDLAANMWANPGETGTDFLGRDKRFNGVDDDGDGYIDDTNGINANLDVGWQIDDHGHGTHVAGIIGAVGNNSVGVVGVAWRVQIMACKFLNAVGDGAISDAIECMNYARSKGAKVVNASWGWYGENSASLRDAIDSLRSAGIIFVAATGNDGSNNDARPLYPASFDLDNIVAVAATTRLDEKADWSNYGATSVDLAAPGSDILSCYNTTDSTYHYISGTSMATPHVVGACALLRARNPSATYRQVIDRLLSTTDPLPSLSGKCVSGGRLNLQKALSGWNSTSSGGGATNQPVVTLSELDSVGSESGPDVAVIRFNRTGDPSQAFDVYWTFSGTAVNGSDFQQLPTSSPFPSGAQATLTITPIDDAEFEAPETVTVTLVAGPGYTIGSPNSITITINDNDQPLPQKPVISLSAVDPAAAETGADPGVVRFYRIGDTSQPIQVNWTLSGSAVNGSDFEPLPTSGTYPAGLSEADLTITPIDDLEAEGTETVTVTLLDGPDYTVGSPRTATISIADDERPSPPEKPVVTITEYIADASETGTKSGLILFRRTGDTSQPIQVNWTFSGSAVNGSDFQQLPTTSPFPAGLAEAYLTITPIDDAIAEGNEAVTVTLAEGSEYTIGSPNTATITITDNDQLPPPPPPTVTVTASDASAGESSNTGTFTVSRSGSTSASLTVNFTMTGTAQNGVDYQTLPGSVTIPVGSSSGSITLTPIDDSTVEGSETAVLTLFANAAYTVGSPNSATVTIADNDLPPPLPTVTVTATDASAGEPGNTGTFTVSRSGSTSASLTVNYAMSGTAQNGVDYQTLPGSVTIPVGSASATITLTPIDDATVESSETAVLTLSANAAYTVGSPNSATVTIGDNDQPPPLPTVTVSATQPLATLLTPGVFTITRSGSTSSSLTVNYSLAGTAQNGTDYQALSGTAVIPAGSSSTTVLVRPQTSLSLLKTVVLTISSRSSYTVGSPGSATVTIPASIGLP